jgi:hypothetical protein
MTTEMSGTAQLLQISGAYVPDFGHGGSCGGEAAYSALSWRFVVFWVLVSSYAAGMG